MLTVEKKKNFLIHVLFAAVVIALGYFVIRAFTAYLTPLLVGLILAVLLQRPADFLADRTAIPRAVWAVLLVLVSYGAVVAIAVFCGYQIYGQLLNLYESASNYIPYISNAFQWLNNWIDASFSGLSDTTLATLNTMPDTIISSVFGKIANGLSTFATNVVSGIPSMFITVVVTVVVSCYVAKDYKKLRNFIRRLIPQSQMVTVRAIRALFREKLVKILKGYLILMFITFVELSIGLLVLRIRYAIPLAAIIAVVDILPVLGVGTVLLPWAAVQLLAGKYFVAVGLIVLYLVITVLRQILEPKILSTQVGLPPLVTLLAMYCGLKLFGFFGMLGFPLALIILVELYRQGIVTFGFGGENTSDHAMASPQ